MAIGAGASAVATTLFTLSFRYGDPVTPAVIQEFQPIIAIAGAALLLHERLRASFIWFAVPAPAGAWLLAFPDPLDFAVDRAVVALLALGAAVLWGPFTAALVRRLMQARQEPNMAVHGLLRIVRHRPGDGAPHQAVRQ